MRGWTSAAGWGVAALAAGLIAAAGAGRAQQEGPEWELQRCVWRCLSAFGPADSAAYAACVSRDCSGQTSPAIVPPRPLWSSGVTSDGRGAFAGGPAEGRQDAFFYLFCARGGERLLQIDGIGGGAGPRILTLAIDGQGFPVTFAASPGAGMLARLPPGAPVLGALQRGQTLEIQGGAGPRLGRFPLAGAAAAIRAALALCR
ncbi:hypothetical protein [Rhodovulum sp. MB263]|uniref:hypothetical protein n=1 Tax=Rhodovulum sp. (strain MB263) TaxID=308754 RepID=UPI0009B745AA|nr:hypothetical protein [Rhodovulum sp. MB263]ARC88878.1 hypothetical protein B5V46_09740 [Rhodovulum sp. MB263]